MKQEILLILIISTIPFILFDLPYIINFIGQIIAIKKGTTYPSDECCQRANGTIHVKWKDDNEISHDKTFVLQPHLNLMYYSIHSNITEVTVYSYKNMASLGKTSLLGTFSMILIGLLGILLIWLYVIFKYVVSTP